MTLRRQSLFLPACALCALMAPLPAPAQPAKTPAATAAVELGEFKPQRLTLMDYWTLETDEVLKRTDAVNQYASLLDKAQHGDAEAGFLAALALSYDHTRPVDFTEYVALIRASSDARFPPAVISYASILVNGLYVQKDVLGALRLVQTLPASDPERQYFEGVTYLNGFGVPKDVGRGIKLLGSAAARDPDAKAYLGFALSSPSFGLNDPSTGFSLLISESQNNQTAQYLLGLLYHQGQGVTKDDIQATQLFKLCAERHNPNCEVVYGVSLLQGRGISADPAQAVNYMTYAANAGEPQAMANLADIYATGAIVRKDYRKAFAYAQKGADEGNTAAMRELAVCYRKGWGTEKNDDLYLSWLTKSADLGDAVSQNDLGVAYNDGAGVHKNYELAKKYLTLAVAGGNEKAKENLAIVTNNANGSGGTSFVNLMSGLTLAAQGIKDVKSGANPVVQPRTFQALSAAQLAASGATGQGYQANCAGKTFVVQNEIAYCDAMYTNAQAEMGSQK